MRPLTDGIVTDLDVPLLTAMGKMAQAGTARLLVMQDGRLLGAPDGERVCRRLEVRKRLGGSAG